MITAWQMYWLLKLDAIGCTFYTFGIIGMMLMAIFTPVLLSDSLISVKKAIFSFVIFFLVFFTGVLCPSTKEMAAIVMIPAIVNNKDVQELGIKTMGIGKNLLDLTEQYIREHLDYVDDKKGIADGAETGRRS